jgi:hypothetical protein
MKKFILPILILFCVTIFYLYNQRNKAITNLTVLSLPQILGDFTEVPQSFNDASSKVGYHVYYPTFLPAGYSLSRVNVNIFGDGEVDYAIISPSDDNSRFIISERPSSMPIFQSQLMSSADSFQAMQWNISKLAINDATGTLAQSTTQSGTPVGFEDLSYNTTDGVDIEIFDSFGYGQLSQVAQSMQ